MRTGEAAELSHDQCRALLDGSQIARLATTVNCLPAIYPVRFAMLGSDPVFRARRGSRLHRTTAGQVLCLEVDQVGFAGHAGWSVVVVGHAHTIDEPDLLERCARLPLQPWATGAGDDVFIRIHTSIVSGRRLDALPVHPV